MPMQAVLLGQVVEFSQVGAVQIPVAVIQSLFRGQSASAAQGVQQVPDATSQVCPSGQDPSLHAAQ